MKRELSIRRCRSLLINVREKRISYFFDVGVKNRWLDFFSNFNAQHPNRESIFVFQAFHYINPCASSSLPRLLPPCMNLCQLHKLRSPWTSLPDPLWLAHRLLFVFVLKTSTPWEFKYQSHTHSILFKYLKAHGLTSISLPVTWNITIAFHVAHQPFYGPNGPKRTINLQIGSDWLLASNLNLF